MLLPLPEEFNHLLTPSEIAEFRKAVGLTNDLMHKPCILTQKVKDIRNMGKFKETIYQIKGLFESFISQSPHNQVSSLGIKNENKIKLTLNLDYLREKGIELPYDPLSTIDRNTINPETSVIEVDNERWKVIKKDYDGQVVYAPVLVVCILERLIPQNNVL